DADPNAAAGAGRQLHRLALHEQHGRPVDGAELPLRQRPGEGDGADRLVQHHRLWVPAAGVEPGDQRGVPVDELSGVHRRGRAADADRGSVHEPVRSGGAVRRRALRDVPVRPDARGGVTATLDQDVGDWTGEFEGSFGGKLEPIPFYGPPGAPGMTTPANQQLPAWEPYPGPVPQESTFVWSAHLGAVYKKMVIAGLHFIDVFANDNERA